jgi:transposase
MHWLCKNSFTVNHLQGVLFTTPDFWSYSDFCMEIRMVRYWLRDDQFDRIAALLPGKKGDPGRTGKNNRLFVEAVLWIARTGSPWRDLPAEFGLWNSVYQRFARCSRQGVWHRLFSELARDADFEEVFIDSTVVRAHQHAAGAAKKTATKPSGEAGAD